MVKDKIKFGFALTLGVFSLYTGAFGILPDIMQRSIRLAFVIIIVFCRSERKNTWPKTIFDAIFALAGALSLGYLIINYSTIASRYGVLTVGEIVLGFFGIAVLLEATRRVAGLPIAIIAFAFLTYGFLGKYIPGFFQHRGYSAERLISHLFYSTQGIFGIPLGASATFVVLFTIFGAFLKESGATQFFMDLAIGLVGRSPGGPAKIAVVSSALIGTVSGSAVANVVTTGTFTIPLMKRVGFKPKFAGAVEAVASSGSQLMPPIMGAAAFIMAEITGISYIKIIASALIPALLYYIAIFSALHFESLKGNLGKLTSQEIPNLRDCFVARGYLILPLIILIVFMVLGYSPMFSVFWSIVIIVVVSSLRHSTRIGFKGIIRAIEKGSEDVLIVSTVCATAGLVVGIISLTGIGIKLSSVVMLLAGHSLFLALLFTMLSCIILGMGLPTAPVYVLVAALMAPALIKIGVLVIAAHMFVFYSALLSAITPPVAVAAYAAAGIAKTKPMPICAIACRIGLVAFIIPYFFVYQPTLLAQGNLLVVIFNGLVAVAGVIAVSIGATGYFIRSCTIFERVAFLGGGLAFIDRSLLTDLIGLMLIVIAVVLQILNTKASVKINL